MICDLHHSSAALYVFPFLSNHQTSLPKATEFPQQVLKHTARMCARILQHVKRCYAGNQALLCPAERWPTIETTAFLATNTQRTMEQWPSMLLSLEE